jgi:hypothetical protein
MAGQGSLCQQVQSARWIRIASSLRSILIFAGLLFAPASAIAQPEAQTELAPVSTIRIQHLTDSIVFTPDAAIEFTAHVDSFTQHASRRLVLRASLLRAGDGEVAATNRQIVPVDSDGNCGPFVFKFTAPKQLGVYEVRLDLTNDDEKIWDRFRKAKPPIAQLGRPIFVVRAESDETGERPTQPLRPVLVHLPNLDWIETFIALKPYQPSSDDEFLTSCDPLTKRALKLWSASRRLSDFIESNGLTGALMTADKDKTAWLQQTDANVFPFEAADIDGRRDLDLLLAVMRNHSIDVQRLPEETVSTIDLKTSGFETQFAKGESQFQQNVGILAYRAELAVGSALDREDPEILAIELDLDDGPLSKTAEEMLRTISATPTHQLKLVPPDDPANETVRVRAGTDNGHGYVSILNRTPWDSEVDLEFTSTMKWAAVGQSGSTQDVLRQSEVRPSHVRATLLPGQFVLLRTEAIANEVSVRSWSSSIGGGSQQIEKIKRDVTSIVERIGLLSDMEPSNSLSNGGFEQSGGIGLVGWMHAQHPPGCVKIDDKESIEGKHSVLLTTDPALSARTWIVSETIESPESGRLAVSLVTRAERSEERPAHQMRISIEATSNGEPVRHSADFEVPRNGQWGSRQIVLETDRVAKQNVESLRLTVDSLSGGRVWLDDVRIHHWFPTSKEREELQSLAFLAVQGLQNGNLTPSSRLLQNRWARYLLARGPSKSVMPTVEAAQPETQPGVAERIRSWLPRPLRF